MEPIEVRQELLVALLVLLPGEFGRRVLVLELAVCLGERGELFVAAGQLLAAGLLGLVEFPAEFVDLRAEALGLTPELLAFGPESIGLAAEVLRIARLLPCGRELFVAAGQLLAIGLLGPLERLAEFVDLRAEALGLTPELLAFGTELLAFGAESLGFRPEPIAFLLTRLLALGERGAKALGRGRGFLMVGGPLLVLGAGLVEFVVAMLEEFPEAIDLAPRRVEVGIVLLRLLLCRARQRGLLLTERIELAPELVELGAHRRPILRQVPNRVRRESSQPGADRLQLGRDLNQPLVDSIMLGLEPVVLGLELTVLVEQLLALGCEQAVAVPKLLVLGRQALVLGLELVPGRLEPLILREELLVLGGRRRVSGLRGRRGCLRLRLRLPRGCDDELVIAAFAADRLADIPARDAQAVLAARAGYDNLILLGPGLDRRAGAPHLGVRGIRDRRGLIRPERVVALLATDRVAEVNLPNLQLSRTVGADGDEMGLDVAHGISFRYQRADPTDRRSARDRLAFPSEDLRLFSIFQDQTRFSSGGAPPARTSGKWQVAGGKKGPVRVFTCHLPLATDG